MFWWLTLIFVILYLYVKFWKPLSFWEERGVPFLKPWPIFGNTAPFTLRQTSVFSLMKYFYNAMNTEYYGIWNFSEPVLIVRDIELVKQICIKDFEHFVDHKLAFTETNEPVFSENIFASKGEKWRELRAILSPVFTGSKMRAMYTLISECAGRVTNYLEKSGQDKPLEMEMKDFYNRCTIDVIATCAYGIESNSFEDKNNEFYERSHGIGDFGQGLRALKLFGYMICPSIMRALKIYFYSEKQLDFFRDIVSKTIAFREKNGIVRPDLLHIMMEARKGQLKFEDPEKYSNAGFATIEESEIGKNSNVKLDITDELIIAQAMVFFIGGTDTNSNILSLTSYELALRTDIQKKLQDEIDQVYNECNGKITYEVITKMKYLDMVISETMRRWPQFLMDRLCTKDVELKSTEPGKKSLLIKKGQSVWIPVQGIQRDPKFYPNPESFDPERFNDENKKNINPYTYLPFGQGPRSCIGNRFALLVVKTFLFHILLNFNFVVTSKTDIPLKISNAFVLNAENGYWLKLEKRAK